MAFVRVGFILPFVKTSLLKDKSGVYKIIVKNNLANCETPVMSSFQVLMPPTFINSTIILRKLGQISSQFCIFCTSVRRRDKEASNVGGINIFGSLVQVNVKWHLIK